MREQVGELCPAFGEIGREDYEEYYLEVQAEIQKNQNMQVFGESINQQEIEKSQESIQALEYQRVENQQVIEALQNQLQIQETSLSAESERLRQERQALEEEYESVRDAVRREREEKQGLKERVAGLQVEYQQMQSEQKSSYKKAHLKQQQSLDSQITLLTQERDKR